jgi:hypothetical protein
MTSRAPDRRKPTSKKSASSKAAKIRQQTSAASSLSSKGHISTTASKKSSAKPMPPGYGRHASGLVIPSSVITRATGGADVVSASKLRNGLQAARNEIQSIVDELVTSMDGFAVREIKITMSFNADGKFMGFGVGGAASFEVTIAPSTE